jgi:cytochrome c oxidase assembly protein Cox11
MIDTIEKVFFIPGDVVRIKHALTNKPDMLVKGKETKTFKDAAGAYFVGIRCFWFTTEGLYQEQIFNTKDICKV